MQRHFLRDEFPLLLLWRYFKELLSPLNSSFPVETGYLNEMFTSSFIYAHCCYSPRLNVFFLDVDEESFRLL